MNKEITSPKVSIVLPTHNGSAYIQHSIESCLRQTYFNIELIIVDDGSTDNTPEIIKNIHDPRIQFIRSDNNVGLPTALNYGFKIATGEFLTWTSDDNFYAPDAIETMLNALLDDERYDFVYANYQIIDEQSHDVRLGKIKEEHDLDQDNYIGGCFLYSRKVYENIGDYNPDARLVEDYEYWLRVRQQFRMKKLDQILYFYRMHKKSLTGTHNQEDIQEQVAKVRREFIPKWKDLYLQAQKVFQQGDKKQTKILVSRSLVGNPFFGPSWRLFWLSSLSDKIVEKIRKPAG
ncbi:MAG: glycosyltransferase family 2 protein [Candidatus Omnitrophica bacterium]|nr:glycosyltransferase family 2 protein [Candidatus Omnitrophota bacterium]